MASTFLLVGGLVAVGFDPSEAFLLTVSHSGRGVFETTTWKRVARDTSTAYPQAGRAIGIGPIEGLSVSVTERTSDDPIRVTSPSGRIVLQFDSGGIKVIQANENE